jgi:excisionase family DNA binding protein
VGSPGVRRAVSDRLQSAREIAELLAVPESWVRDQTRANAIPHVRLGRYRRYELDEVLAWVETLKNGGGSLNRPERRR